MPETVTSEQAIANAARLLAMAEDETNLALMEALTRLAETWAYLAGLER